MVVRLFSSCRFPPHPSTSHPPSAPHWWQRNPQLLLDQAAPRWRQRHPQPLLEGPSERPPVLETMNFVERMYSLSNNFTENVERAKHANSLAKFLFGCTFMFFVTGSHKRVSNAYLTLKKQNSKWRKMVQRNPCQNECSKSLHKSCSIVSPQKSFVLRDISKMLINLT